jgi:hypothetical protein
MYRKLLLAAATLALAQTTVKVSVAGLDAKAAQARIWTAAKAACRTELAGQSQATGYYSFMQCVEDAAAKAKTVPVDARETASRQPAVLVSTAGR